MSYTITARVIEVDKKHSLVEVSNGAALPDDALGAIAQEALAQERGLPAESASFSIVKREGEIAVVGLRK
jgi:hypothetical protein